MKDGDMQSLLIDSKELRKKLIAIKQESFSLLDKTKNKNVKYALDNRITDMDTLLIWLSQAEQKGETNMESLKLGELTKWEPKPKKDGVDAMIIEAAKSLKTNFAAVKVNVSTVSWNTVSNRAYKLREKNMIDDHIVPRKDKDGSKYLVYLDNPNPKRGKGK
jgi:hypothetical protein